MTTVIGITAIGMVSSLGLSAVSACAAARAGLSASSPLEYEVIDQESAEAIPVQGHVVRGFTDGFSGTGRLVRLAAEALADLLRDPELDLDRIGQRAAVFLHAGDRRHSELYLDQVLAPELHDPAMIDDARREGAEEERTRREEIEALLLPSVLELNGLDLAIPSELRKTSFGGPAAFVETLRKAFELIRQGRVSRCLVGAVESLVDGETLAQLHALGLLHSIENAVGRAPGEAAAFLLIENLGGTTAGRPTAVIDAVAITTQTPSALSGQALADAFAACVAAASPSGATSRVVIQNLSGDEQRAMEFGNALVRLAAVGVRTDHDRWYPAMSFGETGAAAGAVGVCLAVRAFAREYARSPGAILWLSSDDDTRAALILKDPVNRSVS